MGPPGIVLHSDTNLPDFAVLLPPSSTMPGRQEANTTPFAEPNSSVRNSKLDKIYAQGKKWEKA